MPDSAPDEDCLVHQAYHIFFPPQLPQSIQSDDFNRQVNSGISRSVLSAVTKYKEGDPQNAPQWDRIIRMLECFTRSIQVPIEKNQLSQDLISMTAGDVLALYIQAQNAGVIVRKRSSSTTFEAFEVQLPSADLMWASGKIVQQYPGPAVKVPNTIAEDIDFIEEIANFLAQMNVDQLPNMPSVRYKGETTDPYSFIQLFFGILRGMGKSVEPPRVTKRITDDALGAKDAEPWRRSPVWLVIRVALQTSLDHRFYKHYMAFHHADFLSQCHQHDTFSSDLLYVMRVKMGKRVFKLKDTPPNFVVERAKAVADDVQNVLQTRWDMIQAEQARLPPLDPDAFDLQAASNQSLPSSRQYLEQLFEDQRTQPPHSQFELDHKPRYEGVDDFTVFEGGALNIAFESDKEIALFDFESAVFEHLSTWTSQNLSESNVPNASQTIFSCFSQYAHAARSHYRVDVADESIMLLTLAKLWVSVDQLATSACPLLLEFSPELPENMLETLLLRTTQHIEAARVVQEHIRARHAGVLPENDSVFTSRASLQSFAVQYFQQSPPLQRLKMEIEQDALQKRQEIRRKVKERARLRREIKQLHHELLPGESRNDEDHKEHCQKCLLRARYYAIVIRAHEWPLPENQLEAAVVLFAIQSPSFFTIWRSLTYFLVTNLGDAIWPSPKRMLRLGNKPTARLVTSSDLAQWVSQPAGGPTRIVLALWPKRDSFVLRWSRSLKYRAANSVNRYFHKNQWNYRLYDTTKNDWIGNSHEHLSFTKYGTFLLPKNGPYTHLSFALSGTTHTTNQILADQFDCPKELSLHEHIAFGTLRSGPRLQWMNIVRGIEENILTFGSQEVRLLHTQAAWQLGPLSDDGQREWHLELDDPEFGELLVSESRVLLDRVRANWLEVNSVATAIMLVSRLIASSSHLGVIIAACLFLREARLVTFGWMTDLQKKLRNATDEERITEYRQRVCETAAICRSTFDVEPRHIPSILTTAEDYSLLVKCFVILYDNQPPDFSAAPKHLQVLLNGDRRLSHKLLPHILSQLHLHKHIVSDPVSDIWPDYQPHWDGWTELPSPNSRWISTKTTTLYKQITQNVHLNLLNGCLLIDGKPLGWLPSSYIGHATYKRLFHKTILAVVPAEPATGMEFATRDRLHGYQVFFRLNDNDLIIRACMANQTYELVPFSRLGEDFPEFLSARYHHWACIENRTIEFRLLSHPWSSSHQEWLLSLPVNGQTTLRNTDNNSTLIDVQSPFFHSISGQLSRLESPRYLHVTLSGHSEPQVEIELPRMRLSFFVNKNAQLESANFRGQVVDSDQSAGTFFGLDNQLVLRAKDPVARSLPRSRSVLVPYGQVKLKRRGHHVSVEVQSSLGKQVQYYRYLIDTDLGYLAGDLGLTARLYKIYLHAITSYCLPDPLTGQTGTDEALQALSESAASPFEPITMEHGQLLKLIGSLTPIDTYAFISVYISWRYPAKRINITHLTSWTILPPLSQHSGFSTATAAILRRAESIQMLHPLDFEVCDMVVQRDANLLRHAALKAHTFYPPGTPFMRELCNIQIIDQVYFGRKKIQKRIVKRARITEWAADLTLRNWNRPIYQGLNLVSLAESAGVLHSSCQGLTLNYSLRWLKLDLSESLITLYNLCRRASVDGNKFRLAVCISSAAFSGKLDLDLISALVAFATNHQFLQLDPPPHSEYQLADDGYEPTRRRIQLIMSGCRRAIESTPAGGLARQDGESDRSFNTRKERYLRTWFARYEPQLAQILLVQWPSTNLRAPPITYRWYHVDICFERICLYFSSCNRNVELCAHLRKVQKTLSSRIWPRGTNSIREASLTIRSPAIICSPRFQWNTICFEDLMAQQSRPSSGNHKPHSNIAIPEQVGSSTETNRLAILFSELEHSSQPLNRQYGVGMNESRNDLAKQKMVSLPKELPPLELLIENREKYHSALNSHLCQLKLCLGPKTPVENIVFVCGVWPRITPRSLLRGLTLKARSRPGISAEWQKEFAGYARSFMAYQRSQRLVAFSLAQSVDEFWKELVDAETDSSGDELEPDWLLVQIEGNFRARLLQRQISKEMVSPSSGSSTVLQLNMGEGKSSVIVPMIAASLANTKQLVRVIVLKPLWHQMYHLLVSRLGGLVDRRIYYFPFGRDTKMNTHKAKRLQELYEECMREGGIILAQPEHILSFKLMSIDRQIYDGIPTGVERKWWRISSWLCPGGTAADGAITGAQLHRMQEWLSENTRDILDESDEILHVRYQLIYTVGEAQLLEDHPDRWITTQQVLHLLAHHISRFEHAQPGSFKYEPRSGGQFPDIQILPDCARQTEERLIHELASDVLNGEIKNLNTIRLPMRLRQAALEFLTSMKISRQQYEDLKSAFNPAMWRGLLLVRGLFASGILVFVLKAKRYRVDYGLDLSRSLLAVPFRAKDIPSLRAEFGHPDVAIVLTALSYYYKGLTEAQLDQCFDLLYKFDNPALEYEQWVERNNDIPEDLRHLKGINVKDREQFLDRLVPAFARNSATIDFFLSFIVFPKEAKEYPHRLSTSGWDLAEAKRHVITGFSGTNDNRYLLPTSITQADPLKQLSTNALVLTYLLQPENNHYICMKADNGHTLSTREFLKLLVAQKPEIRALLDVGAQMLELKNEELVRCWLELENNSEIQAAVYFNEKDELTVLPRGDVPASFYSSQFSQQLDKCIVYLDDGHTRGTDLKLPRHTRALVTLGPRVTKDRLLQGCMRMRKLGHGQSVMFAAPPEIDNQIRVSCPIPLRPDDKIDTLDVMRWAMLETCKDLQHHIPHWAQQGSEYTRRLRAQRQCAGKRPDVAVLKEGWLNPEARTLEEMYGMPPPSAQLQNGCFTHQAFDIPSMRERLNLLGVSNLEDAGLEQEQEREVSHEVEKEIIVQRPKKKVPADPSLHPDILHFIHNGLIPRHSQAFVPLFYSLRSFGPHAVHGCPRKLVASADFINTLEKSEACERLDDYLSPVNWIVIGKDGIRVVLSAFEVNELLPEIRKATEVSLHVYAPRVSKYMRSFSSLGFYSLPHRPEPAQPPLRSIIQIYLDLFAGQLYLSDHAEYVMVCALLGLYRPSMGLKELESLPVEGDGFVKPEHRGELFELHLGYVVCKFAESPIPMLRDLIERRRKGMNFLPTHVGQLLHGGNFTQSDFLKMVL